MQCLSPKSTGFNEFSSNIVTALVCLATNSTYNFSKMIFDGLVKNVNNKVSKFLMYPRFLTMCLRMTQFGQITHTQKYVVPFHTKKLFTTLRVNSPSFSGRIVPLFDTMLIQQGEGPGTPTEPHHTPSQEVQPSSHTHISSPAIPTVTSVPTALNLTVTPSETTPIRQYTQRPMIAQSSALFPVADEPASPLRDVSQGEACPTDSGFIADQDRATIAKSSTLPHDSAPWVTSPAAEEGSIQQTINELTAFCTSLQRQHSELLAKFQSQEVEINRLKGIVKFLEDRKGVIGERYGDDAPIKGRRIDEDEVATERVSSDTEEVRLDEEDVAAERASEDTEEMAIVLTTMDAATVLASGAAEVPTGSGSIPTAGPLLLKFSLAVIWFPLLIDAQITRELKEQLEREDQRRSEQIARDEEITKIHAEEELQIMIDGLDRTKKQKRDFYMAVIRNNLGWKAKDFKGMSFEEVEAKFKIVWEQIEGGVSKISKGIVAWLKRKGIRSEQESVKKQKISEEVPEEVKSSDEVPEEKIKEMMQLITRLGGSSASYQFFIDLLKHLDRDDLNQLWSLVKETLSNRPPTSDKEMKLWVELSRLYEPDVEDQLWTNTQNFMHAPAEWKLYEKCGVHQLTSEDKDIFMLVEKEYPLRKGLELVMICYKLQVENYSHMAENLEFTMERGLRQGDPLSLFLFLLVAKALQVMMIDACNKGIFKGLSLANDGANISLLQYADDALFMEEESIARSINYSHDSLPFSYLGLPVGKVISEIHGSGGGFMDSNWSWRRQPTGRLEGDLVSLNNVSSGIVLDPLHDDKWVWSSNAFESFSVKSLCVAIQNKMFYNNIAASKFTWNYWVPREVNICVCRLSLDQSRDHCIRSCPIIKLLWFKIWDWWRTPPLFNPSLDDILIGNFNLFLKKWAAKLVHAVCFALIWHIWGWRNKILHACSDSAAAAALHEDIFPSVQRMSLLWVSKRAFKSNSSFSWDHWIHKPNEVGMT
nr:RNA-directed DNA polymerase, eukaryota, reverse transcriptase zinc-binding domain protein [Tanacetum cinerariifolium]